MVVIGGSFCRNDALKEEVLQRSRFPVILFIYLFFGRILDLFFVDLSR